MPIKTVIFSIISVVMFACTPKPIENQKEIKEEIENREIRRVTKAEILKEATEAGDLISQTAQKSLAVVLMEKIQLEGVAEAIEHCNVVAIPVVDSVANIFNTEIRRVGTRIRNPRDQPDNIELEILEAYQYAFENNLQLQSNVQEISGQVILYTKPILMTNPVCLNCHGNIGTDILPKNHDEIISLYPNDSATGYKIGDLRGMWSIRLLKKNLIQNMD